MEMQDLIRIMVGRYQREEAVEGVNALMRLAESLGIVDAFREALALAALDV